MEVKLTEFKFRKGSHFSRPFINPFKCGNSNSIEAIVRFTDKSIYYTKDQGDWNKLVGRSWGFPFNKNAVMWGNRYNTDLKKYQLSPYINSRGENFYLDGNVAPFIAEFNVDYFLEVRIQKLINLSCLDFSIYTNTLGLKRSVFFYQFYSDIDMSSFLVTARKPYHGGNTTPYNDYSVWAKIL